MADQAPPNYNPNESMLSGGTDMAIMKVMGGGGGGGGEGVAPNGYNETQSLLSGGIDIPIVKVEGGGPDEEEALENIRIIQYYKKADTTEYNNFIEQIKTGNKLDSVIVKLESEIIQPNKLQYIKDGDKIEISSLGNRNTSSYESVKFIPVNTKQVIVLPPTTSPEDFFNMILFLKQNGFLKYEITKKGYFKDEKELILKKNCFVVHTSVDLNDKINKYFYLKLKKLNNNYEIMNYPHKIVYPKEIDGSKALLFSSTPLNKPDSVIDLEPIKFENINESKINLMYYTKSETNYSNEFAQISNGENDTQNPTNYSITLKTSIAIIDLVDEETIKISVDINGILYKIRVPSIKSFSDKIYNEWLKGKYTTDERRLIEDLYLDEIPELSAPNNKADILFQLSYFKCFNDTSLLTNTECFLMRESLEKIYKHALTRESTELEKEIAFTNVGVQREKRGRSRLSNQSYLYNPTEEVTS